VRKAIVAPHWKTFNPTNFKGVIVHAKGNWNDGCKQTDGPNQGVDPNFEFRELPIAIIVACKQQVKETQRHIVQGRRTQSQLKQKTLQSAGRRRSHVAPQILQFSRGRPSAHKTCNREENVGYRDAHENPGNDATTPTSVITNDFS
jgi:hypothetical protein